MNKKLKIEEVFVFISIDEEGKEEIVEGIVGCSWMQLVGVDKEILMEAAMEIKDSQRIMKIKVLKFTSMEEIQEI